MKNTSIRKFLSLRKILDRFFDKSKSPRSWLWSSQESIHLTSLEEWKRQHDETSNAIRRVMITLIGYSFFCLLSLAVPDKSLLATDATIKIPFAGVNLSFVSFLLVGPFILITLTTYLHIFVGYQLRIGDYENGSKLPFIFNMSGKTSQFISSAIFYWLTPFILVIFTRKALPRPEAFLLVLLTSTVTSVLIVLEIRRSRQRRLIWNTLRFLVLGYSIYVFGSQANIIYQVSKLDILEQPDIRMPTVFNRRLSLLDANLTGQDLSHLYLKNAWMWDAILEKANMAYTDLANADLQDANLSGATLYRADLTNADLRGANLRGADLKEAKLIGADLRDANLADADLSTAYMESIKLEGAYLEGSKISPIDLALLDKDAFCEQLSKAINLDKCFRPSYFNCGASIPEERKLESTSHSWRPNPYGHKRLR